MQIFRLILLLLALSFFKSIAQPYKILESTKEHIIIEFDFHNYYTIADTIINGKRFNYINQMEFSPRMPGEPWLPELLINIGVPNKCNPSLSILNSEEIKINDKFIIPFPKEDPDITPKGEDNFNFEIYNSNRLFPFTKAKIINDYIFRYSRVLVVGISPYQFNPISRDLLYTNKMKIKIVFNSLNDLNDKKIEDAFTENYLQDLVINYEIMSDWITKEETQQNKTSTFWYNSNQNYYKIYLAKKGVYRVTYDELIAAGVPLSAEIPVDKIGLYGGGESIPLDITTSQNGLFKSGDYFQFVGLPPPKSSYSNFNLYNKSNVYWFTFENDSSEERYKDITGIASSWTRSIDYYLYTEHYEEDKIYERWGLAGNGNRDHWQWGKAIARNQQSIVGFESFYNELPDISRDSNFAVLKVNMHGVSNNNRCPSHQAYISLANNELIGTYTWNGQAEATFEKRIDSIKNYPTGNKVSVFVYGDACPDTINPDDEIRINWFEFEYWRYLRTYPNNFNFTSNPNEFGVNRFWLSRWQRDNAKIYIPSKSKVISDPDIPNDQYNSLRFVDTVSALTEYFVIASDYFLTVDSIKFDSPSNLKSTGNGSDYIIITHPNFKNIAEGLKSIRSVNFPDTSISNPRIFIADVQDIYDEFSDGLISPEAIKSFIKYAFENWVIPAPSYIVLLGDMSYDYREILSDSRPNFIPSIPYFTQEYGQTASDNMFVAVAGTDVTPDLAIGRLSIENVAEGAVLLEKLSTYPSDNSKAWKQNVLLFASGISLADEISFGFNDASELLENNFLTPNGYTTSKVYRYPSKTIHEPFQGDGPKIREKINEGGVFVNYYGHGGGYQWDLIFTNDDIYLLENEGRLPFISSTTCYTAHFDNQDVFGEQFNKVPGKGCIGFFGSAGLTYWQIGKEINQKLFGQIFHFQEFITGKAILKAKSQVSGGGAYGNQVALLTLLGDPVFKLALPSFPDFEIKPSGIKINPANPLVGDTVKVQVSIRNFGRVLLNDSVSVELIATSNDTSYSVGINRISSFTAYDSTSFKWIPTTGGLFELKVNINNIDIIPEEDYTDNTASNLFVIYNIGEPNIVKPVDAFSSESKFDFVLVDIGYFIDLPLVYYIEIDTSSSFQNPIIQSESLTSIDGIIKWSPQVIQSGVYFWRTRVFDGENYGRWSNIRSFSVGSYTKKGYYAHDNILKTFDTYNINFSETHKSLLLNTELIEPRPSNKTFIEQFDFTNIAYSDSFKASTMTTDGTYLYIGTSQYFAYNPDSNPDGLSRIYRIGTGLNGTIQGEYYGYLPNFNTQILNQIFYHSDGYIYVATKNPYQLLKVDKTTGDTTSIYLTAGLLRWEDAGIKEGAFFVKSDGNFIYNLTLFDSLGRTKYVLRTLDPNNGWTLVKPDIILDGNSYIPGFSDFFVYENFIYPTDYWQNAMRRIRVNDGYYEEEWVTYLPFKNFYSWCYDWNNNLLYSVTFRPFANLKTRFYKFLGNYTDAEGTITTKEIGPANKWNNLKINLENSSQTGNYTVNLLGFNSSNKIWDTLAVTIPDSLDLSNISTVDYNLLKMSFTLSDSSFGASEPMKLRSVEIDYDMLPEVMLTKKNINVSPDSILQGFQTELTLNIQNISSTSVNDVNVKFYINNSDTAFYSQNVMINADSLTTIKHNINTDNILFENNLRIFAFPIHPTLFTFNDRTEHDFFVSRDSVKPNFTITFDDKELIDGDIISSEPTVVMTVEDNSPLPITQNHFSIQLDNIPLSFYDVNDSLKYDYTPYPNSKAVVTWTPKLEDGSHTLTVFVKDSSGNPFNSSQMVYRFNVFNNPDLLQVYNYPNPFKDKTDFTFEVRGVIPPEELKIKIFTVAGRLIKEIVLPGSSLQIGFNRIPWDGLDQDGDEIANGVYFYKIISKHGNEVKTVTQKLAKLK